MREQFLRVSDGGSAVDSEKCAAACGEIHEICGWGQAFHPGDVIRRFPRFDFDGVDKVIHEI